MSPGIFTVQPSELNTLGPDQAQSLFCDLIRIESRILGIPLSDLVISENNNDADGGIDALVVNSFGKTGDIIASGKNGYQIKTGENFVPNKSGLKKEFFGQGKPADIDHLAPAIKQLLDDNGTYCIVVFKRDFNDAQRNQAKQICINLFKGCNYSNPKVIVLGQSHLAKLLSQYPSLVLFLRPADGRFRSYDSWPRVESFNNNLFLGDKQSELINSLQTELLGNNEQALHIRLIGEPGIGKSRLAFEVTKLDTLRPLVVYGKGEVFKNSDLLTRLEDPDQQVSAILVIDDCDRDTAAIIWSQLKNAGPRIRIVSISNDLEQFTGETKYFSMPSLGNEEIRKILIDYQLQSEVALRWAELCDGFPRVAHVIGSNLQQHPEDVFSSMV